MKQIFAVFLGLAIAGCAPSVPVLVYAPGGDAEPEPRQASDIMNEHAVTPRDGAGAVIVTSDLKSWMAPGCTFDIALDDQLVAALRPGEQVVVFAEPGQRIIGFSVRDEASCDPAGAKVALEIVAHTTQKVLIGSDSNYDLKIEADTWGRSLPP
jgi:hypothetical protein